MQVFQTLEDLFDVEGTDFLVEGPEFLELLENRTTSNILHDNINLADILQTRLRREIINNVLVFKAF